MNYLAVPESFHSLGSAWEPVREAVIAKALSFIERDILHWQSQFDRQSSPYCLAQKLLQDIHTISIISLHDLKAWIRANCLENPLSELSKGDLRSFLICVYRAQDSLASDDRHSETGESDSKGRESDSPKDSSGKQPIILSVRSEIANTPRFWEVGSESRTDGEKNALLKNVIAEAPGVPLERGEHDEPSPFAVLDKVYDRAASMAKDPATPLQIKQFIQCVLLPKFEQFQEKRIAAQELYNHPNLEHPAFCEVLKEAQHIAEHDTAESISRFYSECISLAHDRQTQEALKQVFDQFPIIVPYPYLNGPSSNRLRKRAKRKREPFERNYEPFDPEGR